MQAGDTNYIYRKEFDKACFQHDAAYSDSKDLVKRTQSNKILKEKAFAIANNPKYDGYQRGLASIVNNFFDILRLQINLQKELVLKMKSKKINN